MMNPLKPLPNSTLPRTSIPCSQVWSALQPHHRDQVQHVLLRVCRTLADLDEAEPSPTSKQTEVAHERA